MNPQHTIPLLDDNGTIVIDSHVICAYLVDKYADSDSLYPKDLAKRSLVDARMYFDAGHIFCRIRMLTDFILFGNCAEMPEEKIEYIQRSWDSLNRFVQNSPYVCGDEMTIADLCLIATVSSATSLVPFDPERHAAALQWIDRMSQLPYYEEVNGQGSQGIILFIYRRFISRYLCSLVNGVDFDLLRQYCKN